MMKPDYDALSDEALLDALEHAGRKPPPALLQACLGRAATIATHLLEWLEAGSDPAWPDDDPRWYREIHAGHLLIELREPAALPLFEAIFRDPEREGSLGEWFDTRLPAYGPALTPTLLALATDPEIGWGQVSALGMLGTLGQMHPEERPHILPTLRALLPPLANDGTLAQPADPADVPDEDVERWTWVIGALMDLRDEESRPQVLALYDTDLVDVKIIGGPEAYLRALRGEEDRYEPRPEDLFRYYEGIRDDTSPGEAPEDWLGLMNEASGRELGEGRWPSAGYQAPVRVAPPPGRNAPCPCGSGRKYKHCCGRA
jgi:hypothetical protein